MISIIGTFKSDVSEKKHLAFSQQRFGILEASFWLYMDILWYSHHSHLVVSEDMFDMWDARVLKNNKSLTVKNQIIGALDQGSKDWTNMALKKHLHLFLPQLFFTQKEQRTVEGRAPAHFQSHVNDIMRIGLVDT